MRNECSLSWRFERWLDTKPDWVETIIFLFFILLCDVGIAYCITVLVSD